MIQNLQTIRPVSYTHLDVYKRQRLRYLRGLEERKEEVIRLIEEQGKLTEDLRAEIEKAEVLQRVEDLYKPFKQKKATRASKAREKGLDVYKRQGVAKCEKFFGIENLGDPENMEINHHVIQALKARNIMKRDVDYIVKDGEIIIVDEFTGRFMFGRRYSNGLHQAIEAKEGVLVRSESRTLATITLQNYFRMYGKLAGMTGTAKTEEEEFREIYNMDVVVIPTNKPVIREDPVSYTHLDVYKRQSWCR